VNHSFLQSGIYWEKYFCNILTVSSKTWKTELLRRHLMIRNFPLLQADKGFSMLTVQKPHKQPKALCSEPCQKYLQPHQITLKIWNAKCNLINSLWKAGKMALEVWHAKEIACTSAHMNYLQAALDSSSKEKQLQDRLLSLLMSYQHPHYGW